MAQTPVFLALLLCWSCRIASSSTVPALFLFGDSSVDTGNNNALPTRVKANFPPYGASLNNTPTGRFSDGLLIPDFIAYNLGLPSPPLYSKYGLGNFSQGVNFASAGSGVFRWPGSGMLWTLEDQVDYFQKVRNSLVDMNGDDAANVLARSIFFISTGTNDVSSFLRVFGWGLPAHSSNRLVHQIDQQLERLYSLGARKFVVAGAAAFGCEPSHQQSGHCSRRAVRASTYYNAALAIALGNLRHTYPDAHFLAASLAAVMLEVKAAPRRFGIRNTVRPCCPLNEPWRQCYNGASVCDKASEYLFWDATSPTEAFNSFVAQKWWNSSGVHIQPFNISQLALL